MIDHRMSMPGRPTGWISGFPLHASAWTGKPADGGIRYSFTTLNSPGELASSGTAPAWSFHLNLTPAFSNPTCHLLCNGFLLLPNPDEKTAPIASIVAADGIVVGTIPAGVAPSLFSTDGDIDDSNGYALLRHEQHQTVLHQKQEGHILRFVLATGSIEDPSLPERAQKALELDAYALMEVEASKRIPLYITYPSAQDDPQLPLAIECLAGRLRHPEASLSQRWMAESLLTDEVALEDWYPSILAWLQLDPTIALELFRSLLEHQDPNGSLFWFQPDDEGLTAPQPWLFLGDLLQRLQPVIDDLDQLRALAHQVTLHLSSVVCEVDATRSGQPQWKHEDDALIPELWDEQVVSVELFGLLLADIHALQAVTRDLEIESPALAELLDYSEILARQLSSQSWNESKGEFQPIMTQGGTANRASLGDLLPLLWPNLPKNQREAVAKQFRRSSGIYDSGLPSDWEPLEQDEVQAPLHPGHLAVVLECLDYDTTEEELQQYIFHIRERAENLFENNVILPASWNTPEVEGDSPRMLDANAAALLINVHSKLQRSDQVYANFPRAVRWMDQNRLSFTLACILACALPILGIVMYFNMKSSLTVGHGYAISGLANQLYKTGNHQEAIKMYTELIEVTSQENLKNRYRVSLANAYYAQEEYPQAINLYKIVLDSELPMPMAQWNLAQAYTRLKKFEHAEKSFDRFIEKYGESFPALADRAQHARELIHSQQALDRKRSRMKG